MITQSSNYIKDFAISGNSIIIYLYIYAIDFLVFLLWAMMND